MQKYPFPYFGIMSLSAFLPEEYERKAFIGKGENSFSHFEESNVGDPTEYYNYDEIFSLRPRAGAILRDRDYWHCREGKPTEALRGNK